MRVEEAAAAVAYLTAMVSGYNDDTSELLVYEFEKLDDPTALHNAVAAVARTWDRQGRVPLAILLDAYEMEVRQAEDLERELAQAAEVYCDGSGWFVGDYETPCPRCNPALLRVWDDPSLKDRWRHGYPLHRILGYEDRDQLETELSREPCSSPVPFDDPIVPGRVGVGIAVAAYRAEYGRDPGKAQRVMIAAIGRTGPPESAF